MSAAVWIVVVVAVVVVAAAVLVVARSRKRAELRERFGPEYDRVVAQEGDRRSGERRLANAAHQRDRLDVRDLTDTERLAFVERWQALQAEFVDQPVDAAGHADELIIEVIRTRGYPDVADEERADLLAADHPEVMAPYREAGELRAANATGGDTEALREAVVRYRALFEDLVGGSAKPVVEPAADAVAAPNAAPDAVAAPEAPAEPAAESAPEGVVSAAPVVESTRS